MIEKKLEIRILKSSGQAKPTKITEDGIFLGMTARLLGRTTRLREGSAEAGAEITESGVPLWLTARHFAAVR